MVSLPSGSSCGHLRLPQELPIHTLRVRRGGGEGLAGSCLAWWLSVWGLARVPIEGITAAMPTVDRLGLPRAPEVAADGTPVKRMPGGHPRRLPWAEDRRCGGHGPRLRRAPWCPARG